MSVDEMVAIYIYSSHPSPTYSIAFIYLFIYRFIYSFIYNFIYLFIYMFFIWPFSSHLFRLVFHTGHLGQSEGLQKRGGVIFKCSEILCTTGGGNSIFGSDIMSKCFIFTFWHMFYKAYINSLILLVHLCIYLFNFFSSFGLDIGLSQKFG